MQASLKIYENLKEIKKNLAGLHCRLCLDKIEEKDATKVTPGGLLYRNILDCVSIMITADNNFSKYICVHCTEQLNKWEHFREKCKKSQETLLVQEKIRISINEKIATEEESEIEILEEIKTVVEDFETKEVQISNKIQCQTCGVVLLKANWRQHQNLHSDRFKCPHCSKLCLSKSHRQEHIAGVHDKSQNYICHVCAKRFSTKTSIQLHLLVHSVKKRHKCSLCPFAARTACNLKYHMATHADGKETFNCEKCDSKFKADRNLRDHMYRVHRLEKIHECRVCGRKFAQKYVLENHLSTHTGIKPFHCSRCSKAFSRKCHLTDHEKCHDKRTTYPCSNCAEELISKSALKNHVCTVNENVSGEDFPRRSPKSLI